jgi:glycosyltransferase involved in cell wall biosynthesis
MACGKAIVATDVGGVSEALENCGIVLKSGCHPSEFANAIVRILSDDNLRYKLEVSALRKAKEVFSEEKMLEQYRTTYWNLICNKHTASSSNKDQQLQFQRPQYPQQARGTTQKRMPI